MPSDSSNSNAAGNDGRASLAGSGTTSVGVAAAAPGTAGGPNAVAGPSAAAAGAIATSSPAGGAASPQSLAAVQAGDEPALLRRSRFSSLLCNAPIPLLLVGLYFLGIAVEEHGLIDRYYQRVVLLIGFNVILAAGLQLINGFSGQFSLGHAGFMAVGAYLAAYPAREHAHLAAGGRLIDDPGSVLLFYVSLGVVVLLAGLLLAALVQLIRLSGKLHRSLPAITMLAGLVWIVIDIAASSQPPGSRRLLLVWSPQIDLLTAIFRGSMTHLAPAARALSELLPVVVRQPLCFLILILGGGVFAAATGFLVGLPTLRLRGDYLAIATLGLAEIVRIAIQNSAPLGGPLGLSSIPKYTDFAWLWGFALVVVVLVWRLAYSAQGRLIQAVREDEIAAASVGIDPTRQKVMSFVFGAFFGGVAGALFAMNERSITPSYFSLAKSIEVVVIVTLGGLGSISGAIVAAVVLTLLPELLREIADYRMILYSLLLVVMMLVRPQGLLGGVELWPRRKYRPAGPGFDIQSGDQPTAADRATAADRETAGVAAGDDAAQLALTSEGSTARSTMGPGGTSAADDAPERTMLQAADVCRRFGGLTALSDFSLTIRTGELHGLIGPNGAGKTTAFNVVTGVYKPTSGQVVLGDSRIDGLSPVWINRHGVARTFQNIRLFKNLTVLDNVAAAWKNPLELSVWRTLLRTPRFFRERARSEAAALNLLQTLSLAHLADHQAGSLSYGDQRRLEIARALATRPSILLLDEPAAGMNPQEKVGLMALIRFIRQRFAVGILLIEHDMKLVMNVCERITVLDHGEIIAVDTPAGVQANPAVIEAYLGESG